MNTSTLRIALAIAAFVVAAACDEPKGPPTAPTGVGAGSPTTPTVSSVTGLTIGGVTWIAEPGGTTRLTATEDGRDADRNY